ncbi:hypothetical protein GDO81_022501, partial [Engystomops pustulosus]
GHFPKEGDMIEYEHYAYQHWALYVGGGKVVHLKALHGWFSTIASFFGYLSVVTEETLEVAAAFIPNVPSSACTYKVNNKYDKRSKPFPPLQIVNAARKEVGKPKKYNLMENNCEHFVTELRYSKCFCDQ